MDEERLLRRRQDEARGAIDRRRSEAAQGVPSFVGRVVNGGAMPNRVPGYYLLQPQRIGGVEAEGATVSATDRGSRIVSLVVGQRVPAVGDRLLARMIRGRWVAETKQAGGGGPTVPFCLCATVPQTLSMSVSDPLNLTRGALQNCTLQWQPKQAWNTFNLGPYGFYSTATFRDDVYTFQEFYYFFNCIQGQPALSRIYQTSAFGSPFLTPTQWAWLPISSPPDNTCSPFLLTKGTLFWTNTIYGGHVAVTIS